MDLSERGVLSVYTCEEAAWPHPSHLVWQNERKREESNDVVEQHAYAAGRATDKSPVIAALASAALSADQLQAHPEKSGTWAVFTLSCCVLCHIPSVTRSFRHCQNGHDNSYQPLEG